MLQFGKALAIFSALFFSATSSASELSSDLLLPRQDPPPPSNNNATTDQPSATFFYVPKGASGKDANFTFSLTAVEGSGDLWFSMSATTGDAWIAVGIGEKMKDSTMFIAYRSGKKDEITLSGRRATGNSEPKDFTKDLGLGPVVVPGRPNEVTDDGTLFISGLCAGCVSKTKIDLKSTTQPFIFAQGDPIHTVFSNDEGAPLRQHRLYGSFTMDMTKATAQNNQGVGVPPLGTTLTSATSKYTKTSSEKGSPAHAVIMIFAFLVLFPLGVLAQKVFGRIKIHAIVQAVGLVFVIVGFIIATLISKLYIRSKDYKSAHQIIGIIVVIAAIVQFGLGAAHHKVYMRTQQPTIMIKVHRYLGPITVALGIVNGSLGFRLALSPRWNLIYVPLVLAMVILTLMAGTVQRLFRKSKFGSRFGGANKGPEPGMPPQPQQFGNPQGGGFAQPGTYGSQQPYGDGRSDVELNRYPSNEPPTYGMAPTQPRQMV